MSEWDKKDRAWVCGCLKKWESKMVTLINSVPLSKLTKAVNYDNWNLKMKALFVSQDNWEVVEYDFDEPVNTTNFSNANWKSWKKHIWRTRQLCTFFTKLWMSMTLRKLQVPNLQKKCGIFRRRRIRGMTRWSKCGSKHLRASWRAWRWRDKRSSQVHYSSWNRDKPTY